MASVKVTKPPNVLVQTLPDHHNVNIVQLVEQCLKRDKYIVYPVTRELLETNTAWADNIQLLMLQQLPALSQVSGDRRQGPRFL